MSRINYVCGHHVDLEFVKEHCVVCRQIGLEKDNAKLRKERETLEKYIQDQIEHNSECLMQADVEIKDLCEEVENLKGQAAYKALVTQKWVQEKEKEIEKLKREIEILSHDYTKHEVIIDSLYTRLKEKI